jgi:hypothetical protein
MIVFQETMDSHSLDVVRDPDPGNPHDFNRKIAMLQWHPDRQPRMVPVHDHSSFTLAEMEEMTAKLKEVSR